MAAVAACTLSACSYYDRFEEPTFDWDKPLIPATMTLEELKDSFMQSEFLVFDNADHVKYAKTFTGYQIPESADAVINAVVISSDKEGNTYKKIILQDLENGSSIDVSIDAANLSALWPRGQRISMRTEGLLVGTYAEMPVLGVEYYNDDPRRMRYEVGRMPFTLAKEIIQPAGLPDTTLLKPIDVTIQEILDSGDLFWGKLVRITDLEIGYYYDTRFNEESPFQQDSIVMVNTIPEDIPFSFEKEVGGSIVPISRALVDEEGAVISLTTSSFAKFASDPLPRKKVDVVAIVGWYKDQPSKVGGFQLSLQERDDMTLSNTNAPE